MSDLGLTHTASEDGTNLLIMLTGRLAIDTATELHALLLEQLPKAHRIQLNLAGLEQVDLAGTQLICAACQSAVLAGKTLNFTGSLPETIKQSVHDIGLHRMATCIHNAEHTCIWCGGIN